MQQYGLPGAGYDTALPLYRYSLRSNGIFSLTCHDSPHANAHSRENNDTIKFVNLQGHAAHSALIQSAIPLSQLVGSCMTRDPM
jgi:hypothetical protein